MSIRDRIAAANPIARIIATALVAGVLALGLALLVQAVRP